MRFHVNTIAENRVVNSEAFATEPPAAARCAERIRDQVADNARLRADFDLQFRRLVVDDADQDDRIATELFQYDYRFQVAPCTEPRCVACYEAGLIEL